MNPDNDTRGPAEREGYLAAAPPKDDRRPVAKALLLAILIVGILGLLRFSGLTDYLKISRLPILQEYLAAFNEWTPFMFLIGGALSIILGTPRSLICILGGMIFGFLEGTILALTATMFGSIPVFWLTKWLGRPFCRQRVGAYLDIIDGYAGTNGLLLIVLLRQLPLTCFMANMLFGLTCLSTGTFVIGSVVGMLPETVIFALFGSSAGENFAWRVSLASFLLILLTLIVRRYFRISPLGKQLAQGLAQRKIQQSLKQVG